MVGSFLLIRFLGVAAEDEVHDVDTDVVAEGKDDEDVDVVMVVEVVEDEVDEFLVGFLSALDRTRSGSGRFLPRVIPVAHFLTDTKPCFSLLAKGGSFWTPKAARVKAPGELGGETRKPSNLRFETGSLSLMLRFRDRP